MNVYVVFYISRDGQWELPEDGVFERREDAEAMAVDYRASLRCRDYEVKVFRREVQDHYSAEPEETQEE